MAGELLLCPFTGTGSFVDMRALFLIAQKKSFVGHNLHEFQNGAVLCRAPLAYALMNLPDRGRTCAPEHRQDLQFGIGGSGWLCSTRHLGRLYY